MVQISDEEVLKLITTVATIDERTANMEKDLGKIYKKTTGNETRIRKLEGWVEREKGSKNTLAAVISSIIAVLALVLSVGAIL